MGDISGPLGILNVANIGSYFQITYNTLKYLRLFCKLATHRDRPRVLIFASYF